MSIFEEKRTRVTITRIIVPYCTVAFQKSCSFVKGVKGSVPRARSISLAVG